MIKRLGTMARTRFWLLLIAVLGWQAPLCQPQAAHLAGRDAAREGVASASSVLSAAFTPSNVVDGLSDTAWLSGVLPSNSMQVEEISVDLRGVFTLQRVEVVWGSSGGPRPQDLRPFNYSVEVGLGSGAFTALWPSEAPNPYRGDPMEPLILVGTAAPIRHVRLRVWGTGRNSFYGVAALRVFAQDAALVVHAPANSSWLTSGATAAITWDALPGIPSLSLELLNTPGDRTPITINMAANQPAGSYAWEIPATSRQTGRSQVGLSSDTIVAGSNYYLRVSRPQGMAGRRITALVGPLAISGNMARGAEPGATSWDSLSSHPSMALDGVITSSWSSDCDMGIGGSSGGDVGEVLQVFLPAPAWIESFRVVWSGPSVPDAYKIWYLPLDASQRTGAGVDGVPNPMADLSMGGGYMAGWEILLDWQKPSDVVDDPERGRVDLLSLDVWPVAVDVVRLQIPYNWLASCYPLAEFEANGVPLLSIAEPIDFSVVKAGVVYTPRWVTPPGATPLADIVDGGVISLRFDSDFDVIAAGWVASNVSGWGVCYGQPFSESSGIIVQDAAANAGEYDWNVPCVPGAQQYYISFEFTVASNPTTEPSEFFSISREPQSPREVVVSPVLARTASLAWVPGYQNGAVIERYVVELRRWATSSRREQHTTGSFNFTGWSAEMIILEGAISEYVLTDLAPYTNYTVRLSAANVVGPGAWSELVNFRTEADVPDSSRDVRPATINSANINMTWRAPYHNGDLVTNFRLDLNWQDDLIASHLVTMVKCRDPDAPNVSAARICPRRDEKGYMDCFGVRPPVDGTFGNCPRHGWLRHDEACYLRCKEGLRPIGRQPSCSYGTLSSAVTCVPIVPPVEPEPEPEPLPDVFEAWCSGTAITIPGYCSNDTFVDQEDCELANCTRPCEGDECFSDVDLDTNQTLAGANQTVANQTLADANQTLANQTWANQTNQTVDVAIQMVVVPCEWTPDFAPTCDLDSGTPWHPIRQHAVDLRTRQVNGWDRWADGTAACPPGCTDTVLCVGDVGCVGTAAEVPSNCSDGVSVNNQTTCEAADCDGVACEWTPAVTPICDLDAETDGSDACHEGCVCTYVKPPEPLAAELDLQLTGDPAECPGRSVHQTPPGQCPYRDCLPSEIRDCNGVCLSATACVHTSWGYAKCADWGNRQAEGDGFCANGNEKSDDGYHPNFNCPYHFCEGGDCRLDPLGNGVPCGQDFDMSLTFDPDADLTASCEETPTPVYHLTFIDTISDETFLSHANDTTNIELLGGGPVVNASGAFFDGDDGVVLEEEPWGSSGQITISFWMNKYEVFTGNQFEYVFSQNPIAARSPNIQMVVGEQSYLKMTVVDDLTNRATMRLYDHVVMWDRWQHIALTCGRRGLYVFVGGVPVPRKYMTVLSGDMDLDFGRITIDGPLYLASRSDRHPDRFYVGGLASVLVFQHMLNHQQVHCLYSSKWEALIEETCYDAFTVIDAAEAGVIGLDGSQTFCGPAVDGMQLWHTFDGLVSGVNYTIAVTAVNAVGGSEPAIMHFASRTALMQTVPVLIERSVTKPHALIVESMLVNLGDGNLLWNVSNIDFIGQIHVSPTSSVVKADGVGLLRMEMQSPGLPAGTHKVEVTLSSNAATRPGTQIVVVMMSVISHASVRFSLAEGASLSQLTRGSKRYHVFIHALDEDNVVAVAENDPFTLRVDHMPVVGSNSSGTGNNASVHNASAMDWSKWYPPGEPVSQGIMIGFGSGVYRAEYDAPAVPGRFLTSVLLDGVHIRGSPFHTQSVCARGEYDDETGQGCILCDLAMMSCDVDGTVLSNIQHKTGVWRSSTRSREFHWCSNGECLPGVGPHCNEGYSGNLCRSCAQGYGKIISSCIKCAEETWVAVTVTSLLNLLPFVTVRLWVKYHVATRELYRSQRGAIFKIGFNFLQMSSMIPAYQSAFPPVLEILFGVQRSLSDFGSSTGLVYSCVLQLDPVYTFYGGVMASIGMPTFLATTSALMVLCHIYYGLTERFDKANQRMLYLLLVLYVAFPTIVRVAAEAFSCITIDTFAFPVLRAEPAVSCAEQPQAYLAVVGAIIGVAIPGIPMVLLTLVWRARQSNTLEEETTIWRFGWMHAEYEYAMWEGAVLFRKALLALLPALLPDSAPQTLYLVATCAFFFAILVHALFLPYSVPYAVTAQCELVSLLCSFAIFACCFFREGIAASSDEPTVAMKRTDGVAIAIVMITAFALWFFKSMHKLVGILEGDGQRSSAISWADIQTYFRYSLIPHKGASTIRKMRQQKRIAPLRGPEAYVSGSTSRPNSKGGGKVGATKRKGRPGGQGAYA